MKNQKTKLEKYIEYLTKEEKSSNTIEKYLRDIKNFLNYMQSSSPQNQTITKELTINWKKQLQKNYAATSINSMIASLNSYLQWQNLSKYKVKPLKIQNQTYTDPDKELNKQEYKKLIQIAQQTQDQTISIIIQTIGSTGIRISELKHITLEAATKGKITIKNKGKTRTILLPKDLTKLIKNYCNTKTIKQGIVFRTKTGKPIDRSNIWKKMKNLCSKAGIKQSKVFPHNLRKLFAKTFYNIKNDISKLADLLGHTNINTTRLYIKESGKEHIKQLEKMQLIYTVKTY